MPGGLTGYGGGLSRTSTNAVRTQPDKAPAPGSETRTRRRRTECCGWYSAWGSRRSPTSTAAVSSTQLEGCLNHVRVRDILERHTNAARFAEGRLHACLADAGRSCAHALLIANEAENEDPSEQLPRLQVG